MSCSADTLALLRLRMIPGLGPVLIERVLARHGSAVGAIEAVAEHGPAAFLGIERISAGRARELAAALPRTASEAEQELAELDGLGASLVGLADPGYPELLRSIPAAPPVLSVRGALGGEKDRFSVAVVGSRGCSAYGAAQARRFASALGLAGLTVVSGGARGIDTEAHSAALRAGARTVVVLGCGLGACYPPENRALFDAVVDAGGAVVSELPVRAAPEAKNFPARNRIISGMSLGTLVIEAGARSGALITARVAAEDQGREVLAVPGRVDSAASAGCLELIRAGAGLAVTPGDVLEALEAPARHAHASTHATRYGGPGDTPAEDAAPPDLTGLTETQRSMCHALAEPKTLDELARETGIGAEVLRAEATMLEIRRVVVREGARIRLRDSR